MKKIYFVTEGETDQIFFEGLISEWLGGEDFEPIHIQPPNSSYVAGKQTPLSEGWRGVVTWCSSTLSDLVASRSYVIENASLLVIHVDGDVAFDAQFAGSEFASKGPPVGPVCSFVKNHLSQFFLPNLPLNIAFCVPSRDLECWILCCLFPTVADANVPIECYENPANLLLFKTPKLVRRKDGRIRKDVSAYEKNLKEMVQGWANCVAGPIPRCSEAVIFENAVRAII
jgi:hypothetical protein